MTKPDLLPDEIWACVQKDGIHHWVDAYPVYSGSTKYIRADLVNIPNKTAEVDTVKIPTDENEAVLMNLLSYDWLKNHAPHRLKDQQTIKWQNIYSAPKHEVLFVCRDKSKPHVTFEAAIFKEQESWEYPEQYDVLHDMSNDEPITDSWDRYEWAPISAFQTSNDQQGEK